MNAMPSSLDSICAGQGSGVLARKPHYPILDGLRGVAALVVVLFHFLEAWTTDKMFYSDQLIGHGYICVEFFFILSGFVIGYAYDDRWGRMSLGNFFKRRLIRLQPMVIMGSIIGGIWFYFQGSVVCPGVETTSVWLLLVVMLIGATVLPVPLAMDVRGWGESHPLNGPCWSLFYEYIANVLYATVIRRFSFRWLMFLVLAAGALLVYQSVSRGNMIGGWSLTVEQMGVGMSRLMFPFFGGLLLFRSGIVDRFLGRGTPSLPEDEVSRTSAAESRGISWAFGGCSLLLVAAVSMPYMGGEGTRWVNGLYDALCIILVFPLVVLLGACGRLSSRASEKWCSFLGDISYPLYITHYPVVCWYFSWMVKNDPSKVEAGCMMGGLVLFCVLVAYLCLRFFDAPVRQWVQRRLR